MSRFEAPPGIVTNGLVLNLDAGDPDSYTRSQPPYVEVLVVAGGGSGGNDNGGGGGAGGLIIDTVNLAPQTYSITVGDGAPTNPADNTEGENGEDSVAFGLTAIGGGGGGGGDGSSATRPKAGGSGGGGDGEDPSDGATGLQPSSSSGGFGNDGGDGAPNAGSGGGGGGAGAPGTNGSDDDTQPGNGGDGLYIDWADAAGYGDDGYFAGGGGGSPNANVIDSGFGLGGRGGGGRSLPNQSAEPGTPNTGGGGGGTNTNAATLGGAGGSGIVIVRYPGLPAASGGTITYLNGYTIHTFTTSGTFTPYLWNDVSGNGNNGTLLNGTGFNPYQNGGFLTFDGVDDRVLLGSPNVSTSCTVNQWIQPISGSVTTMRTVEHVAVNSATAVLFAQLIKLAGTWYHQILVSGYQAGYAEEMNIYLQSNVTSFVENSTPYNFTLTWERIPGVNSTLKTYLNGVYKEQNLNTNNYWANIASLATSTYNIGSSSYKGNISTTSYYNRVLSAAEITQNYNAQKSRFGL